ncbi:MAG TPA: hypothetical protein VI757_08090, partial [Bacteroidia bacterium]|nr:hypothetical protein [Bacteroidia bacterium]
MFRIVCFLIAALTISVKANSQAWQLNGFDKKKINRPANTYQAEQKYSCELMRIGKLIVKPLLKDSVIHYELAIQDKNDRRN